MSIPFERSFASNPKSIFWSKKNEKQPRECCKSSDTKYLFDCICGHEIEIRLSNITHLNRWCGFCSNPPSKLCDNEECKLCLDKSFASNLKCMFWSKKNNKTPREYLKNSHSKCLFVCNVCSHECLIRLDSITRDGNWCGYCGHQTLCENNDCKTCEANSFSSHPRSIFWSKKNVKTPRDVFKSASSKHLFDCEKCGHEFKSSLNCITTHNSWCPHCINKTETKLYERMIQFYPFIITQFKQEWCKNIRYLPFDFCIQEHKIIIELDGRQHFIQVKNWKSPEENFETDKYKEKCANENGYSIIRILQEDVFNDKYDWCKELCETTENIKNGKKVVNIYLCKKNEYYKYK